jgi:hypothetical protein
MIPILQPILAFTLLAAAPAPRAVRFPSGVT